MMRRQDAWWRSSGVARDHHLVTYSCHGPQVDIHVVRKPTFHRRKWITRWCTVVPLCNCLNTSQCKVVLRWPHAAPPGVSQEPLYP